MEQNVKIYICGNDDGYTSKLVQKLRSYLSAQIHVFSGSAELLNAWYADFADVVFIDVDASGEDGFHVAAKIAESRNDASIVFAGSDDDTVFEIWEYRPFWFLRKAHARDLQCMLPFLAEKIEKERMHVGGKCLFKAANKMCEINLRTLERIECYKHDLVLYYINGEKKMIRCKMQDAEVQLLRYHIVRVQKGIMVNCRFISRITATEVVMHDETRLTIGRHRSKNIKNAFEFYLKTVD